MSYVYFKVLTPSSLLKRNLYCKCSIKDKYLPKRKYLFCRFFCRNRNLLSFYLLAKF